MANLKLKLLLAGFTLAGRKKGLQDLFRLTAAAFGREVPALRGQSRGEMLGSYARFTGGQVQQALAAGTSAGVRKTLYETSRQMGRDIRARLPIRSRSDAAAALHCLYACWPSTRKSMPGARSTVRRCFFAAYYTPEVCRFISAMDEGIVAGICGGRLVFSQRLTEGADCCRGRIGWPDGESE